MHFKPDPISVGVSKLSSEKQQTRCPPASGSPPRSRPRCAKQRGSRLRLRTEHGKEDSAAAACGRKPSSSPRRAGRRSSSRSSRSTPGPCWTSGRSRRGSKTKPKRSTRRPSARSPRTTTCPRRGRGRSGSARPSRTSRSSSRAPRCRSSSCSPSCRSSASSTRSSSGRATSAPWRPPRRWSAGSRGCRTRAARAAAELRERPFVPRHLVGILIPHRSRRRPRKITSSAAATSTSRSASRSPPATASRRTARTRGGAEVSRFRPSPPRRNIHVFCGVAASADYPGRRDPPPRKTSAEYRVPAAAE